jgi:hypothetical protein
LGDETGIAVAAKEGKEAVLQAIPQDYLLVSHGS